MSFATLGSVTYVASAKGVERHRNKLPYFWV